MTPALAVLRAVNECILQGDRVHPRGMYCRELLNVTINIKQPWYVPFEIENRKLNHRIGALEALQLVGQTSRPELMPKSFEPFKDGRLLRGAYGPRVANYLEPLQMLLTKDPDTRQAVLSIYDSSRDLAAKSRDIPCTLSIQFFIREHVLLGPCLHARVSMRSNDVWLGLPYDLIQFITLQGALAEALNIPMGEYTHTVGSMHLYERNLNPAKNIGVQNTPIWDEHAQRSNHRIFKGFEGDITARSAWCRQVLDSSNLDYKVPLDTPMEAHLFAAGTRRV